ncbi:MAG: glycosyltransferase [Candidatus Saganbacteria bacterium]|nr:glycosyltransferase [Candidatus Saganbacteria bacterium]
MRLAIVHDYLNQFGGAERVVSTLHEIWPEAPIYTSIYDPAAMPEQFSRMDIRVSFMQNLPLVRRFFKVYFFLYPLAFERFDLSEYDVILSSSSAYAKGVRKRPGQLHVCYCHTPARFLWRYDDYVARENIPAVFRHVLPFLIEPIRQWDRSNSGQVDLFAANSQNVAERIRQTYGRESVIINPPVESALFQPSSVTLDYFLVVSRLAAYKRLDIVIEAFNRLGLPLKIIGSGLARRQLEKLAGPEIEFLGRVSEAQLAKHLAECRALIFPGEEDFGIVPLEAMASGRPVIAYRAGGALETVIDEVTGIMFDEQTPHSLELALKRFQFESFDKAALRSHAVGFDKEVFKSKIRELVETKARERDL